LAQERFRSSSRVQGRDSSLGNFRRRGELRANEVKNGEGSRRRNETDLLLSLSFLAPLSVLRCSRSLETRALRRRLNPHVSFSQPRTSSALLPFQTPSLTFLLLRSQDASFRVRDCPQASPSTRLPHRLKSYPLSMSSSFRLSPLDGMREREQN